MAMNPLQIGDQAPEFVAKGMFRDKAGDYSLAASTPGAGACGASR